MEMEDNNDFLNSLRFWVQKVLVPVMVCVGVAGNTVTVVVLTRRRMRCSTNIYLTALAVADIIYLFFVLVLSFSHSENIHDSKYELYWRFYGLVHWLCDAASSSSVWLTVSFTVERYIAVCHPIKGKVLCTENRAKSIIVIVSILCILTTASTTFEYQLTFRTVDCASNCTAAAAADNNNTFNNNTHNHHHFQDSSTTATYDDNQNENNSLMTKLMDESLIAKKLMIIDDDGDEIEEEKALELKGREIIDENNDTWCCSKNFTIHTEQTALGSNKTYQNVMRWYSAICFALLPLVLIALFNCFLIHAVYRSQKRRRKMTSSQQENITISNENRITIMLIGVIILFLLCQTPTAVLLIYENFDESSNTSSGNIKLALGNIFNLLVTVNAACNFVLYCVLSKKYRATFKSLFCERRRRKQDTIVLSTNNRSRNSQKFDPRKTGLNRTVSTDYHTPRNLETTSLTSIPRSTSLITRPLGKAKSTDINT